MKHRISTEQIESWQSCDLVHASLQLKQSSLIGEHGLVVACVGVSYPGASVRLTRNTTRYKPREAARLHIMLYLGICCSTKRVYYYWESLVMTPQGFAEPSTRIGTASGTIQ